jgi:hypothetical protein
MLFVAVGLTSQCGKKASSHNKGRSVSGSWWREMRRTPFSLMLDKIPGQQRKVPREMRLRMGKEEAEQYGRGRLELQVVGQ